MNQQYSSLLGIRRVVALGLFSVAISAVGCTKKGASSASGPVEPAAPGSVPPPPGGSLLKEATFESGKSLPWMGVFSAPGDGQAGIKDGAFCMDISAVGTNRWDAQIRHREMVIQKGHTYVIQFRAWASKETKAYPKVGMSGPPYAEYFGKLVTIGTAPQYYQAKFTVDKDDDPTAEFAMHLGGSLAKPGAPLTVCIDDAYLSDPQFTPPPPEEEVPPPNVRVNQVGYLPGFDKLATVVNSSTEPLDWELKTSSGASAAKGKTAVVGNDASSGDHVHQVDFSSHKKPGQGYVLTVGDDASDPFDIDRGVYKKLKYDALAYFYHNRSGIEIAMPYAGEEQWARPAGHKPDKAACAPQDVLDKAGWKTKACDYTLDVSGGWYDAGDHGKYVVNGGISLWTMLNQYERFKSLGKGIQAFADKKLSIPEGGNGIPDILDEARWQMEFMLRMQVPEGKPNAGMVHHKMHDQAWTALGLAPHQDEMTRLLRPVSTAATLNVAANAAQAARIWNKLDPAFSKKCLAAAERAYAAAKKNPKVYAPEDSQGGGGPYDDSYVVDEFYWAAAELYATTGEAAYYQALSSNPHHKALKSGNGLESLMTWQVTDALGAISLATVNSKLPAADRTQLRGQITQAADKYLEFASKEGYSVPFGVNGDQYPWGSNSFVVNNALVMALAYDFTKDAKYLNGAANAMDYLLGRNAMAMSYVSGYGERPLKNPHHRFWAHQAAPDFPSAPPGALSGGPNSGLQDPYVKAAGLPGCKPQKCYLDHIEAWSTNEITINWNAPLAWVAAFLDEQAK